MGYSPNAVKAWLHRTLGIDHESEDGIEVCPPCPKCGGDKFYFNIKSQLGICHKASCDFRCNIHHLIEIVGFPPGAAGIYDKDDEPEIELPPLKSLPGWPVLTMDNMTYNLEALEYLRSRKVPDRIIRTWGLTCDGQRIYVPILDGKDIVNFNSRLLPSCIGNGRKYLYAEGRYTGRYILGWEECRDWTRLSLVENTFVSLSLRNDLHCSTTFGSNISNVQAALIGGSRIRTVSVCWDEGAELKAEKAIKKLHDKGVKAAYWRIKGQPDDYPEKVREWVARVYEAAERGSPGVTYVDLTKECEEYVSKKENTKEC